MKKLTIFILSTIISNIAIAEFEIPNEFEDGQVTSASQMNENFQALKAEIEILRAQLETRKETHKTTFVGVTDAKFDGAGRLLPMGKACDAMVKNSVICSENTFKNAIKPEDIEINGNGWLLESISSDGCRNFTNNSSYIDNIGINIAGSIVAMKCSNMQGVACCK
jgi:uncharacterized small protein (DUF1192 family)